MKIKTLDKSTYSTCPGGLTLSNRKLKELRPELYGLLGLICRIKDKRDFGFTQIRRIKEHIYFGDSQPAIVLSIDPLIIAAYSEDLDCIIPIKFPKIYAKKYKLKEKSRVLTINTYVRTENPDKDIILGKNHSGLWGGIFPIIAEFVSDDKYIIKAKKKEFTEDLWGHVYKLGLEYREKYPDVCRDGRPIFSAIPVDGMR